MALFAFSLELSGPEPTGVTAGVTVPSKPAIDIGDCALCKGALSVEDFWEWPTLDRWSLGVLALTSG
jgi:hypothetical protein